jgi:hypothetical protein
VDQEIACDRTPTQERFDFGLNVRPSLAGGIEENSSFAGRQGQRVRKDAVDFTPVSGAGCGVHVLAVYSFERIRRVQARPLSRL